MRGIDERQLTQGTGNSEEEVDSQEELVRIREVKVETENSEKATSHACPLTHTTNKRITGNNR